MIRSIHTTQAHTKFLFFWFVIVEMFNVLALLNVAKAVARVSVRMLMLCHIRRRSYPSSSLGHIFHLLTNFVCLLCHHQNFISIHFCGMHLSLSLSSTFSPSRSLCFSSLERFGCYLWMRCRAVPSTLLTGILNDWKSVFIRSSYNNTNIFEMGTHSTASTPVTAAVAVCLRNEHLWQRKRTISLLIQSPKILSISLSFCVYLPLIFIRVDVNRK